MDSEDQLIDDFNYSKKLTREQLELIANSLIGPLFHNRHLIKLDGDEEEQANDKFEFWIDWLEIIKNVVIDFDIIRSIDFPPHPQQQKLDKRFFELSEEDQIRCSVLVKKFNSEIRNIVADQRKQIDLLWNQYMDKPKPKLDKLEADHRDKLEALNWCEDDMFDDAKWFSLNEETRRAILQEQTDFKSKCEQVNEELPYYIHEKDAESSYEIQKKETELSNEIHRELSTMLGEENAEVALGMGTTQIECFLGYMPYAQFNRIIEGLQNELQMLRNGEVSSANRLFSKKERGDRRDPTVIKEIKNQAGIIYRGLRNVGVGSDQAVDAINDYIRQYEPTLCMTKDAIVKRAPSHFANLPIRYLYSRKLPLVDGAILERYKHESMGACIRRHVNDWFGPYNWDLKNLPGNK